jgi:phytoene dehydrogenase-like protein
LARVANYIHLNPICAGLVPVERVTEYRASSLPCFLEPHRPSFLDATVLLRESGGWPDSTAGWREYLRYLRLLAAEDPRTRDRILEELSRGWAIGSTEFRARLKDELEGKGGTSGRFELLGADLEAHLQARADLWEERIQSVAAAFGVDLGHLPALKSAREKMRVAAIMKRITSVSGRVRRGHVANREYSA